jgi:hypothetical protein
MQYINVFVFSTQDLEAARSNHEQVALSGHLPKVKVNLTH